MLSLTSRRVVSIGEAMVQMAPAGPRTYAQAFAGDTFNTAWHLAQLLEGHADVGFLTRIGCDGLSDSFLEELVRDGLDVSVVTRDPHRQMGLYVIELHGFERSFHYWRGDSAARGLADDPDVLRRGLEGAGLIHVSGITLAILGDEARTNLLEVLAEARRKGAVIAFDPNVRPRLWPSSEAARLAIGRMCEIVDVALPSFDDERALWGDASPEATMSRLALAGVREVVVKNGAAAVSFTSHGATGVVETPAASRIVDTTGAGDAFNAGFLAGRLMGRPCEEAIALGQRLSSEVIGSLGACAPRDAVRWMRLGMSDPRALPTLPTTRSDQAR